MRFRMANTFTASLRKLTSQEQRSVKTTAFDLQTDPSHPSLKFHRVDRSRDPNFWTVRVNQDLRIVVHKREADLLLAYVDHHDDAYAWAERRRIEVHPKTGAAQIVEVRELVQEVPEHPKERYEPQPAQTDGPRLFDPWTDADLLACGVPEDWLADVRAADEDRLLDLAAHLPAEASEALLNLAVGIRPEEPAAPPEDPFEHPDAQRRFRLFEDSEELEAALEAPWDEWTVFLHPSQQDWVDRDFAGPARVSGSAGTGKTVVALHRAVRMARAGERVLLATFTETLADDLRRKLTRLVGPKSALLERISIRHMEGLARELHEAEFGDFRIATEGDLKAALRAAKEEHGARFTIEFLVDEWTHVVDAWDIKDSAAYAEVPRLGRKTRVGGRQREVLWDVVASARAALEAKGLTTWSSVWSRLTPYVAGRPPFNAAVIDESQDLSVAELRFLAALAREEGQLFFAGDIGQRIFRQPFSWRALGVDIVGRSRVLKVNYRTSQQIRARADRLLPGMLSDLDGVEEERKSVVSVFGGPDPEVAEFPDVEGEVRAVAEWLQRQTNTGVSPSEIGVIVRTEEEYQRAISAIDAAGLQGKIRTEIAGKQDAITVSTMPLAKGLEFRAVAVMACDEDIVPLSTRLEGAASEAELTEVYTTERHLLYVACTRARDHLLVTGVAPASEYLTDLSTSNA